MSGSVHDNEDLTLGRANQCESRTRLERYADSVDAQAPAGTEIALSVGFTGSVSSPPFGQAATVAISGDDPSNGIGVRGTANGVGGGVGVQGTAKDGTGVEGTGKTGGRFTGAQDTGVYASGRVGVHGIGTACGITAAVSNHGAGQLCLQPIERAAEVLTLHIPGLPGDPGGDTGTGLPSPDQSRTLPAIAPAGTFLALRGPDDDAQVRIWLCVRSNITATINSSATAPALWAPVQLGDAQLGAL